jgi:hypothetical protein
MSVDVRTLEDPDRWDELLGATEEPTPFHRSGTLDVLAMYVGADCHRLVGYVGEEPIGLFPLFTLSRGPVSAAFSPPPDLKVPYLGPTLLNRHSLKRRRRDKRHRRFVDACLEWVADTENPQFVQIRTAPGYDDVRPFVWQDFSATPRYTYVVDLSRDPDELLSAFSSDARKNVSADYEVDYVIEEGGVDVIERVLSQLRERHAEQDEPFPIDATFVTDLFETLDDGVVRPYVCRVDGEFAGGNVNVEAAGGSYRWLGGAKPDVDIPVNDLLDWRYVTDASERGIETYDLAGANDKRIARYKAKFAPELVPYYRLRDGTLPMTTLLKLYDAVR